MSNEEIFKKAVLKAEKNGFSAIQYLPAFPPIQPQMIVTDRVERLLYGLKEKIIFSHDFLKAFFGEEMLLPRETWYRLQKIYEKGDINKPTLPAWKHHAQQLVLEENPLIYLEKYI